MKCYNCGEEGPHFVPPGGGDPGFYMCKPKGICKTCNGKKKIWNSTSGIVMGGTIMVDCPTCCAVEKNESEGQK